MASSSLFLFTKASNLTNRGIVKTGPYAWWCVIQATSPRTCSKFTTLVPLFFADPQAAGFSWAAHAIICASCSAGWPLTSLRSITEEQFLCKDPSTSRLPKGQIPVYSLGVLRPYPGETHRHARYADVHYTMGAAEGPVNY